MLNSQTCMERCHAQIWVIDINTTALHLGRCRPHLLLLKRSMAMSRQVVSILITCYFQLVTPSPAGGTCTPFLLPKLTDIQKHVLVGLGDHPFQCLVKIIHIRDSVQFSTVAFGIVSFWIVSYNLQGGFWGIFIT